MTHWLEGWRYPRQGDNNKDELFGYSVFLGQDAGGTSDLLGEESPERPAG